MTRHFHRHTHYHPRKQLFKGEESSSKVGKTHKRLCPNCGNEDFSVLQSSWSWLLGQKNKCSRCGFIFKNPFTELEYQKSKEFERTRR